MDFVCGEEYKPLIPDGTYQAQCIRYDESFCLGKARKLFLHFRIVESEKYHGQTIFMPFNMPRILSQPPSGSLWIWGKVMALSILMLLLYNIKR